MIQTLDTLLWRKAEDDRVRGIINELRAEKRRHLYQTDPLYRLSKLKDKRERRMRAKLHGRKGTKW